MIVIGYTHNGMIRARLDGDETESIVPDDMDNRHRQMIAEWEAAGNTIPPYVAPDLPLAMPALTRRQLRLGLLSIGITNDDIETHIAAIENPTDRAAALIEWQDASSYERDHPVLVDVATALGLPPEQVDALWLWAAGL